MATAESITDTPRQVWLLGDPWVLVRLEGGLLVLEDRCPHRLAPLSLGTVFGDELQCGYHGWRFKADGRCVAIPAINPTDHIPPRAHARRPWGIQERYGLVWLAPEEAMCPLPEFVEWERDGFDKIWTTITTTRVSAGLLVDNFLDASHFPFVHKQTFGDDRASLVVDDGVESDGWFVRTQFSTWYRNFDDPLVSSGEHDAVQPQDLLKQGGASLSVYLRLYFPITGATLAILFCCTPETADQTRIYKLVARDDIAGDAERISQTIVDEDLILAEDLRVLERYTAMETHLDQRVEVHTKGDRLSLAWRRLLAQWAARYASETSAHDSPGVGAG